jgi:hypothetical protein
MLICFVLQSQPKKSRHFAGFAPLKSNFSEVESPPIVRSNEEDVEDDDEDELWSMVRFHSDRFFLVYHDA